MRHEDIVGWCDYESAITETVRHFDSGLIVEVGSYLGRSLAYWGDQIKQSGKALHVIGIDCCVGTGVENGRDNHQEAVDHGGGTMAGLLHRNMLECGVTDVVSILVSTSERASAFFADESLVCVFLDARHDYESVKKDIRCWLPKVKRGGWIGGDDYCVIWPGVQQAVDEMLPGSTKWSWDSWRYIKP